MNGASFRVSLRRTRRSVSRAITIERLRSLPFAVQEIEFSGQRQRYPRARQASPLQVRPGTVSEHGPRTLENSTSAENAAEGEVSVAGPSRRSRTTPFRIIPRVEAAKVGTRLQ